MTPSEQDLDFAILGFKRRHNHDAMRQLIMSVAGVDTISQIPVEKREAVIAACEGDGEPAAKSKKLDWATVGAKAWSNYENWRTGRE